VNCASSVTGGAGVEKRRGRGRKRWASRGVLVVEPGPWGTRERDGGRGGGGEGEGAGEE